MRGWMAVLLSGFLLRSLIPVGFMPMAGPGFSVRLVICDSYAPMPMDMSRDMPMDAGMDMSHRGSPPVHQDRGSCPYGASPVLGALPTAIIVPLVLHRPPALAVVAPRVNFLEAPRRAHLARGPPV